MNSNLNHESPLFTNFKKCLLLLLMVAGSFLSQAQDCPSTDYILTSQAEVNAFPAGCDAIVGSLTVSGADITDLTPLSNVTTVGWNLTIQNNPLLASLNGLDGINSVGFQFIIKNNPLLTAIDGFNNLTTLGRLQIESNSGLLSVNGFTSLAAVTDRFRIQGNPNLVSLGGFVTVGQAARMTISNNPSLTSIANFISLTQINFGELTIIFNFSLTSLDGLSNIGSINNNGSLTIANNTSLTDCCAIHDLLNTPGAVTGAITIQNNDTGCDSEPEITTYCEDADMDGFNIVDGDCNDDDDTIYPNAPELCNGIDDDCDGDVDEGIFGFTFTGDVTFNTQAELDAWPPCYSAIAGNLTISGADITDLSPLNNITSVSGDFYIKDNTLLTNVGGLSSLANVGKLFIQTNPVLNDLSAFSNLTSCTQLWIIKNISLTNLIGFSGLTSLIVLNLTDNFNLISTEGFPNLTHISSLAIISQLELTNLDGFFSLTSINATRVTNNPKLTGLDALSPLTSVPGLMRVDFNFALTNLDALAGLTFVGGNLVVRHNNSLTDCCGIHYLLDTPGAVAGNTLIELNDTGCDSAPEVITYCQDADMDGVNITDGDCDDNDNATFPGATEICDGKDNDCNGMVDDGPITVHNGNVVFSTQAQINAWSSCVITVNGHVTIMGAGIVDLSPLANLQTISGNLTIQTTGVVDLAGLQSLGTVGGTVSIVFNTSLASLTGLEQLTTVGGSFMMYYNFLLSDCCAIDDLLTKGGIGGSIVIFYNGSGSHCNSAAGIMAACPVAPLIGQPSNGSVLNVSAISTLMDKELTVYPNPAHHEINIRFNKIASTASLQIVDMLGRVVFEKEVGEGMDRVDIDLNNGQFKNGIYLVSLFENGKMSTRQLVVQR